LAFRFEDLNGFLRASFETITQSSGKSSKAILQHIAGNQSITIPELATRLSQSTRSIEKLIAQLKKEGSLRRIGAAKGGYREIVV
jgi:predicted HTH transcriptional regulator